MSLSFLAILFPDDSATDTEKEAFFSVFLVAVLGGSPSYDESEKVCFL